MMTLIFQKNRLLLAGFLAFAILFFTQITVLAYDYGGGWGAVRTVGGAGVQWLNIGSSLVDADINVGEMPSVTTQAVTNKRYQSIQSYATIHGVTSSMGVASNAYTYFDWGYTPAFGNTENMSVISGTGSQSKEIAVDSAKTIYYQYRINVDSVNSTGGVQSFLSNAQVDTYTGLPSILRIVPLLLVLGILISGGVVAYKGLQQREVMIASIGIVMIAVAFIGFGITFDSIKALLVR